MDSRATEERGLTMNGWDTGGTHGAGNALDTGWVLGYLLVALGALWAFRDPAAAASDAERACWPIAGHPCQ